MENLGQTEIPIQQNNCRHQRRRVVLFPLPLQGHINPMLQLANILYSKGFQISIIHTHFNSPSRLKYPHFTFHQISDGLSETEASTEDIIALLSLLNKNCVGPFRDCLTRLLSDDSSDPIACLITDAIWHFSQAVADGLKLRRLVLRTSNVCSFLAYAALDIMRDEGYLPKQDSQLEEIVPKLLPLKVKDLPFIKTKNEEDFYHLIGGMIGKTRESSGIILNSFKELEESSLSILEHEFSIPNFPIGSFHKYFPATSSSLLEHDKSSVSWLDTQKPNSVIYVSFGSIATIEETEFLEIAHGLVNSNQPFLWVVRPRLVCGSDWIEFLPNGLIEHINRRGHIVKWAPQQEVLAHPATSGFWTHCGWNSTLESICEGVPMICSPCFGDQLVNSRYISDVWKIGVELEDGLKREDINRAIRRVMVEREGEDMRFRIMELKEKVDCSLKEGGSSTGSLQSLIDYILSL